MKNLWNKYVNRETILYLFFGIVTTVINYVVYYLCRWIGIDYRIANLLAWVTAVAAAYLTNKLYVFESRSFAPQVLFREIAKFTASRVFSLACEMAFLILTVEVLHANDLIMKLIAAVFVVILNYVFSKLFIFKKEKSQE